MDHLERLSLEREMNLLITFINDSKRHIKNLELEAYHYENVDPDFEYDYVSNLYSEIGFRQELVKFAEIKLEKIEKKIGLFK